MTETTNRLLKQLTTNCPFVFVFFKQRPECSTDPGALTGAMTLSVVLKTSRSTSSSTSVPLQAPGIVTMETPIRYPETSECRVMTSLRWDSTMAHWGSQRVKLSMSRILKTWQAVLCRECGFEWNTYGSDKRCEVAFHLALLLPVGLQGNTGHSDPVQTVHCSHFLRRQTRISEHKFVTKCLQQPHGVCVCVYAEGLQRSPFSACRSPSFTFSLVLSSSGRFWFWASDTPGSLPAFHTKAPRTLKLAAPSVTRQTRKWAFQAHTDKNTMADLHCIHCSNPANQVYYLDHN